MNWRVRASCFTWDSIAAMTTCGITPSSSHATRTRNSTGFITEASPRPTCYLCAPAVTDPDVAPAGGEALYVLVHTPCLRPHHDWKTLFPAYRPTILDKLKETAGLADLDDRIEVERWLTPQDIHDRFHILNGARAAHQSAPRAPLATGPAQR
jgi:diapolycopene oxygenase